MSGRDVFRLVIKLSLFVCVFIAWGYLFYFLGKLSSNKPYQYPYGNYHCSHNNQIEKEDSIENNLNDTIAYGIY